MATLKALRDRAGVRSLLSAQDNNPKVAKNAKAGQLTAVLHLAPGNMSGHEVCPGRSPGCSAACLHFAGSPAHLKGKTKARIAKTQLFFRDRNLFLNILALEIDSHIQKARNVGLQPSIRLNGTSDICFEAKKFILFPEVAAKLRHGNKMATNIVEMFPTAQFYDYTALVNRRVPDNYHLTFSMKEDNLTEVIQALARGLNIAVVFPTADLPQEFEIDGTAYKVIDGDEHDFRPSDPTPCIIGLKAKGTSGKRDTTGFVQRTDLPGKLLAA